MREPKCEYCKGSKKAEEILAQRKNRLISYTQYIRKISKAGEHCAMCIHNEIRGLKAKGYAKAFPAFQTMDLFEDIDINLDECESNA